MKKRMTYVFLTLCIVFITVSKLKAEGEPQKVMKTLPAEVVIDKIRGGLLGEILGDLNGLRHEMRYINEPGNVKNYVPSLPEGAWTDDDTDFEWFYICLLYT